MSPTTSEEVMEATYRALCRHGYANLTMQDIADESSKSKAALHYHYDSKAELLAAFQAYLAERFLERIETALESVEAPEERLRVLLDAALSPPEREHDLEHMQTALLALKAQAPYESRLREQALAFDAEFRAMLAEILEAGIETGAFDASLDPETTAKFILTVLAGAQTRHVSVGQSPGTTRELVARYVEDQVRSDDEQVEAPAE